MPRKEYKTITVKRSVFLRFVKERNKSKLENSEFLIHCMNAIKSIERGNKQ